MAGSSSRVESSPVTLPPSLKKSSSSQSSKNQKSILGFFQKKSGDVLQPKVNEALNTDVSTGLYPKVQKKTLVSRPSEMSSDSLTPAPSSDALEDVDDEAHDQNKGKASSIVPPITPADSTMSGQDTPDSGMLQFSSPSRKVFNS